tara:strand:- start:35 stop:355 length:321 start_codon:yes stop_codon:yes gene_type:complete
MLDQEAILKAYPDINQVTETQAFTQGCVDVTATLDQAKIDAARSEINTQDAATLYQKQRTGEAGTTDTIYASIGDQLDMQYKDAINGTTTWKDHIAAVKAKYPKPS